MQVYPFQFITIKSDDIQDDINRDYFQECDAVKPDSNLSTFRKNVMPLSSW
jgi:hypothetical protein